VQNFTLEIVPILVTIANQNLSVFALFGCVDACWLLLMDVCQFFGLSLYKKG
jgi:hypothetical protein